MIHEREFHELNYELSIIWYDVGNIMILLILLRFQDVCNRLSIRASKKIDPNESGLLYHYRPADELPCRKEYMQRLKAGDFD